VVYATTTLQAVPLPAEVQRKSEKSRELPIGKDVSHLATATKDKPVHLPAPYTTTTEKAVPLPLPITPQVFDNSVENMVIAVDDGTGTIEVRTLAKFVEELLELRARTKGTGW
jgi:hypothetical protein